MATRPQQRNPDQDAETRVVTAGSIPQVGDEHRRHRLGDAVGGEHDAHEAAEHLDAEQFGGHEGDDEVFAAEAEAEQDGEQVQCGGRRREEQRRDGAATSR